MNDLKTLPKLKLAAQQMRACPIQTRNRLLDHLADDLIKSAPSILRANAKDLKSLPTKTPSAFRDRLTLNQLRLQGMEESLRQIARLPDPLMQGGDQRRLSNGLLLERIRAPLGVILMIYESRPNVGIECFGLAIKSANVIVLRGGKEARNTNKALYQLMSHRLQKEGLPTHALWGITNPDRKLVHELLKRREFIDIVVPRGGDKLIEFVVKNSHIPIIKNDRGLCHAYVDAEADLEMALRIVDNGKTQRPGVCNSLETVLVHETVKDRFIPKAYEKLSANEVTWYTCPITRKILKGRPNVHLAKPKNWDTEYLDMKINCRVVKSLEEAISHIETHGSRHSEVIVTHNQAAAEKFQAEVDAACVYWNASTRFTDGFEFGLGGELGISTQKLHVRGPVGLEALTSLRWVITGTGQIR
ncbi:MAG: glutamate-5-semialdehyde dehydrogenase [Bdellovibrionales bacterium]